MNDSTKSLVDAGAGAIAVSAVMQWLPAATAILSFVWVLIRRFDTTTVQRILGKSNDNN